MENIVKNPGLQHIIETSLLFFDTNDIATFLLVNQDCKNVFAEKIVSTQECTKGPD